MESWNELCIEAYRGNEAKFENFVKRFPYFIPVNVANLKVGDRVVCISQEYWSPLKMSDWQRIQAWDVPVIRVVPNHRRVLVEWVNGLRNLTWFSGLVFKIPYVVSLDPDKRQYSMGRRPNDFKLFGGHLKYRCRYDDFLPNPPARKFVHDWITNRSTLSFKAALSSAEESIKKDIYFQRLLQPLGDQEWKLILQKIITAHQPNCLLGQLLKQGSLKKIIFAIEHFHVDKKVLNGIRIGSNWYHPTEILVQNRDLKLLDYLVKTYELDLSGKISSYSGKWTRHFSAVLSSVEFGDPSILRNLTTLIPNTSLSALLSFPDEQGRTPLSLAVADERPDLVEALLELKASVNECGWGGDTALALGMQFRISPTILTMLRDAGANVDTPDTTGLAPKPRENIL